MFFLLCTVSFLTCKYGGMKKILAILLAMAVVNSTLGWGFLGHRTINNKAVFSLPPEMFAFYKKHIDYITQHAVDPDNRRYLFENEGCKHYLDCDHYEHNAPLDTLPHNWYKAVEMYTEDTLKAHGIVPWNCLAVLKQLTHAFELKDVTKILKLSADIGHYIADAHVPLHASSNYNGQQTGQEGIHALWESRIPQLFLDSFDLLTGTVTYLEKPGDYIWNVISESFGLVDTVLYLEKTISLKHLNNKYAFEVNGNTTSKVYGRAFCFDYHKSMDNMVAIRMQQAVQSVAAFWYTAWVDAGQPDLNNLDDLPQIDSWDEKAAGAKAKGKILGRGEPENILGP